MMDRKSQILLVVTFTALLGVMAYNLRPQYCINSFLVDQIELSFEDGSGGRILNCNISRRENYSEDLLNVERAVKRRLAPLEAYLSWNFQKVTQPAGILVLGSQRQVYQIRENRLVISPDQIFSGALERGVFKLWLKSELGIDSSLPDLLQESLVDLFLHAAGYESVASSQETIQRAEESWHTYPSSALAYCQSTFRLPEHGSLCQAMTSSEASGELDQMFSELSLRPLHSLVLIEAFVQLDTSEQLSFGKEMLKSLSYTSIFGWTGGEDLLAGEDQATSLLALSLHFEQWLKALGEGNQNIEDFSELAQKALEKRIGQHSERHYMKHAPCEPKDLLCRSQRQNAKL